VFVVATIVTVSQQKHFENQSAIRKVMGKSVVVPFLFSFSAPTCTSQGMA